MKLQFFIRRFLMVMLLAIHFSLLAFAENYPYRSDYLWQTVPDHADWLYKTGEKAKVEVSFSLYGIPQNVEVTYEIGPDMMPTTSTGKVMLKNGKATIDMGTLKKPGFLDLRLTAKVGDKKYQHHVKVGFSPEQLKPYTKNPSDFDAFWQSNVETARKQVTNEKLIVKCEKVEKYTTDEFDCYLLKLKVDSHHSIYGYLTKPKDNKKHPVVLCPPGAGIKTIKEPMRNTYYAKNGFIRLEMEIHGLSPEMTDEQFNGSIDFVVMEGRKWFVARTKYMNDATGYEIYYLEDNVIMHQQIAIYGDYSKKDVDIKSDLIKNSRKNYLLTHAASLRVRLLTDLKNDLPF